MFCWQISYTRIMRQSLLRSPAICKWSLNEMFKWSKMQHVSFGGINFLQKHNHHVNTDKFTHVLRNKHNCLQERRNRNVHALIGSLPSPKFSLKEWSEIRHSPPAAVGLGVGGLIPFISAPSYLIYQGAYCPDIAYAQLAYGAVILSFLGGIKWGCAIVANSAEKPTWTNLGLTTVSSLTAWAALLVPQQLGLVTVATGITIATYVDLISTGYPSWFKALRVSLSSVAITTLILMLILSLAQKKNTQNKEIKVTPENH